MTYQEVVKNARERIGKYCKACNVCNGRACTNLVPGPGAKGSGDGAIRNFDAWKNIRVNMDTICENAPIDTSVCLFGKEFAMPVFAGPVGAVNLHYGDCYDDTQYNKILVNACAENGIRFYLPSPIFCTDNAAMIGAAGYYEYMQGTRSGYDLNAVPNLKLGER